MKIRIETIWQKKVGIPEKYYKKALKKKEEIEFLVGDDIMKIPYIELKARNVGKSGMLKDKWGGEDYRLIYFNFKPMTEDEKLMEFSKTYL